MVTPVIDMSGLTTPEVGFWFASDNTNNAINHTISLDAWDGTAWVNVTSASGNFSTWTEVSGNVPAGIPTTTKFRIQAIANPSGTPGDYYQNDLGVDDFFVKEAPTCQNVASLSSSAVTQNSFEISFTVLMQHHLQMDILLLMMTKWRTNFVTKSNFFPIAFSGLSPNTEYTVTVQADCGTGTSLLCL